MTREPWPISALALASLACRHDVPPEAGAPSDACSGAWLEAPAVGAPIAAPADGGHLVLHAAAKGTQNYRCAAAQSDGGASYAWALAGPEATLSDCHAVTIGQHFAGEAGAPEWRMLDGAYVVAHKTATWPVDAGSVPWLLLSVDGHGGAAPFTGARYVQRVRTSGGVAPAALCDADRAGTLEKVPYAADYFFYAP